jgi:hypothetical protein
MVKPGRQKGVMIFKRGKFTVLDWAIHIGMAMNIIVILLIFWYVIVT